MRCFIIIVFALVALLPLPTSAQTPVTRPAIAEEISPVEELSVTTQDGRTAIGVVRKPPGRGPFPAVVVIHGGTGPRPLSVLKYEALNSPTMTRFLAAGYVTTIPTFHSAEDPQALDALWDTLAIVDHVKQMGEVDPNSVVVYGCSVGGDLVLEIAGETEVAATTAEEPFTILFTRMFTKETPKGGASFTIADVSPLENAQRFPRRGGRVLCVHGPVSFHRARPCATKWPPRRGLRTGPPASSDCGRP